MLKSVAWRTRGPPKLLSHVSSTLKDHTTKEVSYRSNPRDIFPRQRRPATVNSYLKNIVGMVWYVSELFLYVLNEERIRYNSSGRVF